MHLAQAIASLGRVATDLDDVLQDSVGHAPHALRKQPPALLRLVLRHPRNEPQSPGPRSYAAGKL